MHGNVSSSLFWQPTPPRQVLLAHYVKPPFVPAELDIFVESMLSTRTGHGPHLDQPERFRAAFAEHLAQA